MQLDDISVEFRHASGDSEGVDLTKGFGDWVPDFFNIGVKDDNSVDSDGSSH